jgi:DNA-3-methyladenine glycosylase II
MSASVPIKCREPFDFQLSLKAMRSFGLPPASPDVAVLRMGVRLGDVPTLLEMCQKGPSSAVMTAEARPQPASPDSLHGVAARVLSADLDLQPFYDLAVGHPVLGALTRAMYGLKAFRPASPFDMLVIAVVEQQISLVAAQHIRARLVARFGAEVEGEPVFPTPAALAAASLDELTACGLSRRKAEYIWGLAAKVAGGEFDLEALEAAPSDEVRERIVALRGFGPWSADYFLIRGLARPDALPADDLGIRTIVGKMLGDGSRPSAEEVGALLAPLAPYRGLAAFYLLVAQRLPPKPHLP